jgi:hypothetical protein
MDDDEDFCWDGGQLKPQRVLPSMESKLYRPLEAAPPEGKVLTTSSALDGSSSWLAVQPDRKDNEIVAKELRLENEILLEKIRQLEANNLALNVELRDARWSADRAIELSASLAKLSEENAFLQRELTVARHRLAEYDGLDVLQERLLALFDSDHLESTPSYTASQSIAMGAGVSPTKPHGGNQRIGLPRRKSLHRQLELLNELVARGGRLPCLQCLIHSEAKERENITQLEKIDFYQLFSVWDSAIASHRYVLSQAAETETEQMWLADQASHDRELREAKQEAAGHRETKNQLSQMENEAKRWKERYRTLKEAGRKHVEELHRIHDNQLKETRLQYLRCNPNLEFVRGLCLTIERMHRTYIEETLALNYTQKELNLFRIELQQLKIRTKEELRRTGFEVDAALRRCLPIVWDPVAARSSRLHTEWSEVTQTPAGASLFNPVKPPRYAGNRTVGKAAGGSHSSSSPRRETHV